MGYFRTALDSTNAVEITGFMAFAPTFFRFGGMDATVISSNGVTVDEVTINSTTSSTHAAALDPGDSRTVSMLKKTTGTGTISTSSPTAVLGVGTAFLSEVAVNDYIRVNSGSGNGVWMLQVTAVADDANLTVEDPFSSGLFTATTKAFDIYKPEGTPVALTGPAAQVTGAFGDVALATSDLLYYRTLNAIPGADPPFPRVVVKYSGAVTAFSFFGFDSATPAPPFPSADSFSNLTSFFGGGAEAANQVMWPTTGTFKRLVLRMVDYGAVTGTETMEAFLRVNGADTALGIASATLAVGQGESISRDDVNTVSVVAGDLISVRAKTLSGGGSPTESWAVTLALTFEPS